MGDALILLEAGNPLDIRPEDLVPLRDHLREATGFEVATAHFDQQGAGVTLDEVLHVWLPTAEFLRDQGYEIVIGMIIEGMRQRFSRRHSGKRRKRILVRDDEGRLLEEWIIESEDAPAERRETNESDIRPRPPVDNEAED